MKRIVVITGATGGIGVALCQKFARGGDRVIAVDLDPKLVAALALELGEGHRGEVCDVASESAVVAFFARMARDFGRVDVLVNNAAIGPTMTATADTIIESVRKTLAVNLGGPFLTSREAARLMIAAGGGVIVNVASLAGIIPNPKRNAYAASKAGVVSLTRALAGEWAAKGVRVCGIAPGYVRTPMVARLERDRLADLGLVRRRIPMGRVGRPDEIAASVYFMASDRARYVTGTTLVVDGGWQSFNAAGDASKAGGIPAAEMAPPQQALAERPVAVITGAGGGIGGAVADRLAATGYRLVLVDKDADAVRKVAAKLGADHFFHVADVSSEDDVVGLFATVAERCGRLDLLVNNAAIADDFRPTLDQTLAGFNSVLEANLTGALICAREAVRLMLKANSGVIVNLGSVAGNLPMSPRNAYGASKAALMNLTGCMAAELAETGLRVVTVAPGYIRTPAVAALEQHGKIDLDEIRRRIPMGDLGLPEDIADAIDFLASTEASYITGATLFVDGGWSSFGAAGEASEAV